MVHFPGRKRIKSAADPVNNVDRGIFFIISLNLARQGVFRLSRQYLALAERCALLRALLVL